MRVNQSTRVKLEQARELFLQNGNLSRTAREIGVHRSTLDRWAREGLLERDAKLEDVPVTPLMDVGAMIQKALGVIDRALEGDKITPAQLRSAIEVVKASNSLRAQAKAEEAKKSLAELIAEEDEQDSD